MTNYNERLDEIVWKTLRRHDKMLNGPVPSDILYSEKEPTDIIFEEAKQAITSLIKELVAEAKPEKHLVQGDSEIYDDYDHDREQLRHELQENNINIGHNSAIDLYDQNLLKALEEVYA